MSRWHSPWDGGDRRVLAWVLAGVLAWDLLSVVLELGRGPLGPPHPAAPAWVLGLARSQPLVIAIAIATIAALPAWVRRRDRLWPGLLVLAGAGILVEAAAAIGPGPWRARFFAGAMIGGDLLARLWAQGAGADPRARDRAGEAGAVAALSASYLAAATSKLLGAGAAWADGTTLAAVALFHAPLGDGTLAARLADDPALTRGFAIATLVIQASGGLYWIGRTSRAIVGVALIGFHVGVAAITSIGYWQPVVLLVVFSLPWPRWIDRWRDGGDGTLAHPRRGWIRLGAVGGVLVAAAWLVPWRSYTALHHRPREFGSDGASVAITPVDELGPLHRGDDLVDGWWIASIETMPGRIAIVVAHRDHGRARLWLGPKRTDVRPSPFDGADFGLAYDRVADPDAIAAAALAIRDRLAGDDTWRAELRAR